MGNKKVRNPASAETADGDRATEGAWEDFQEAMGITPETWTAPQEDEADAPKGPAHRSGVPWCAACKAPVAQTEVECNIERGMPISRTVTMKCHGATFRTVIGIRDALPTIAFEPLADAAAERAFLARAVGLSRDADKITAEDKHGNIVQIQYLSREEAERLFVEESAPSDAQPSLRPWPTDMMQIDPDPVGPLVHAVVRMLRGEPHAYDGLDLPRRQHVRSLPPPRALDLAQEAIAGGDLQEAVERVLWVAFELGMEQGRRSECAAIVAAFRRPPADPPSNGDIGTPLP